MTRTILTLLTLATLAACGADGAPKPPAPQPQPGLTVSGQVQVGVVSGS